MVPTDSPNASGAIHAAPLLPNGPQLWTRNRIALLIVGYLVGLGGMILIKGIYLSPDRYFVILLVPALVLGVGKGYVRDFLPLIIGIFIYEELRGVAHILNPEPYYMPHLKFDEIIFFGNNLTIVLQDLLWTGQVMWYDQVLGLLNRAHFIVPPTLLLLIWLENRALYYRALLTIVGCSMLGAVIFLIYPAAPPWAAAQIGLLPEMTKIGYAQADASPIKASKSLIESLMLPNPYAAVPSLHTAYSTLVAIFALRWHRRFGYVMCIYPLAMYFCIVYFADHYVSDILVGIAVALFAWWAAGRLIARPGRLHRLAGPFPPPIASARFGSTTT
ncbi:MAG: phosphatase PAP2 family protein [Actinobacteria bacterium]|nr:phosphatase PAP2 family protein [Actinomycetota bacterium]